MKIGLVSAYFFKKDIYRNSATIIKYLEDAASQDLDLVCFGEAFLQGFGVLSFNNDIDYTIAVQKNSEIINIIAAKAKELGVAVAFGYIEKSFKRIYSSYMFIGKNGKVISNYRKLTKGWRDTEKSNKRYREGRELDFFTYENITFTICFGGDLFEDELVKLINTNKPDVVLWPVFLKYSLEDWPIHKVAYLEQASKVTSQVLLINSLAPDSKGIGGCYHFLDMNILNSLKAGEKGMITVICDEI